MVNVNDKKPFENVVISNNFSLDVNFAGFLGQEFNLIKNLPKIIAINANSPIPNLEGKTIVLNVAGDSDGTSRMKIIDHHNEEDFKAEMCASDLFVNRLLGANSLHELDEILGFMVDDIRPNDLNGQSSTPAKYRGVTNIFGIMAENRITRHKYLDNPEMAFAIIADSLKVFYLAEKASRKGDSYKPEFVCVNSANLKFSIPIDLGGILCLVLLNKQGINYTWEKTVISQCCLEEKESKVKIFKNSAELLLYFLNKFLKEEDKKQVWLKVARKIPMIEKINTSEASYDSLWHPTRRIWGNILAKGLNLAIEDLTDFFSWFIEDQYDFQLNALPVAQKSKFFRFRMHNRPAAMVLLQGNSPNLVPASNYNLRQVTKNKAPKYDAHFVDRDKQGIQVLSREINLSLFAAYWRFLELKHNKTDLSKLGKTGEAVIRSLQVSGKIEGCVDIYLHPLYHMVVRGSLANRIISQNPISTQILWFVLGSTLQGLPPGCIAFNGCTFCPFSKLKLKICKNIIRRK
ncbi:MAG: hypothetical protein ABIJ91_00105 [Candidatus Kuenenbacteria bacterium]